MVGRKRRQALSLVIFSSYSLNVLSRKVPFGKIETFLSFPLFATFLCVEWSFCLVASVHYHVDLLAVQRQRARAGQDMEIIINQAFPAFPPRSSHRGTAPQRKGREEAVCWGLGQGGGTGPWQPGRSSDRPAPILSALVYFSFPFYY